MARARPGSPAPRRGASPAARRNGAAQQNFLRVAGGAANYATGMKRIRLMGTAAALTMLQTMWVLCLLLVSIFSIITPVIGGIVAMFRLQSLLDGACALLLAASAASIMGLGLSYPDVIEDRATQCFEKLFLPPGQRLEAAIPTGLSPGAQTSARTFGGVVGVGVSAFILKHVMTLASGLLPFDVVCLALQGSWLAVVLSSWPSLPTFTFIRSRPSAANSVYLKCIRESGSKLRVRVISPGYNGDANCQFPRDIRADGTFYRVARSDLTIGTGARGAFFYRVTPANIEIVDEAEATNAIAGVNVPVRVGRVYRSEDPTCVVCLDNSSTRICVPCGHMCMCNQCDTQLSAGAYNCPLCRAPIGQTISQEQME